MEPEWRLEKQQWAGHVWEWGNIWFFMPASAGSSLSSETEAWSCCCYPKDVAFLNVVEVDGDRQISHIQSSILLNTWTFPTDILLPWILPWVLTPNFARLHSQNTLYLSQILALGLNSYPAFSHYWCELGKFYLFINQGLNSCFLRGSVCRG